MDVQERRKFIAEQVATLGEVEFALLAEACEVSEMTIRRDIETLEQAGALRRVLGGAISIGGTAQEPPFQLRASVAAEEKELIAHAVVDLLSSGETVVLDSGSTVLSVAREIRRRAITLTVVTPSVLVALELSDSDAINVHLLGGLLRSGELSLIGPDTVEQLNQFNCDTAVLGVAGIDLAGGISDYHRDEAYVKKAAIRAARRTIVAADHSKLGRSSLIKIAGLEEISVIVTDGSPRHPTLVEAQSRGVSVTAVQSKEEVSQ
jgi:DeoR/GlpR family transcriptional regulator of sugar metabolism